jgi:NAD(P)-dependent dehydrogenase (short-subunit alcohol dehydrogenase family)
VVSRREEAVAALAAELRAGGSRALGIAADVGSQAQLDRLRDIALGEFGTIEILVNNAGAVTASPPDTSEGIPLAEWEAAFRVNVFAPYYLSMAFAPGMRAAGYGAIVNVLSAAAFIPTPSAGVVYSVTKSALGQLTTYLASELGPAIRVNAIAPGTIDADGVVRAAWEPLVPSITLRRIGRPAEVAEAALYLASPAASYTTGQTIFVDGGRVRNR